MIQLLTHPRQKVVGHPHPRIIRSGRSFRIGRARRIRVRAAPRAAAPLWGVRTSRHEKGAHTRDAFDRGTPDNVRSPHFRSILRCQARQLVSARGGRLVVVASLRSASRRGRVVARWAGRRGRVLVGWGCGSVDIAGPTHTSLKRAKYGRCSATCNPIVFSLISRVLL